MGSCGGGAAAGIQRLLDADARFFRAGLPVYYVESKADVDGEDFAEMGMIYVPTSASGISLAGTTQTLVDPPPSVTTLTLRNLSDAANVGAALRLGALSFTFSNTWVSTIMLARGYANGHQVFTAPKVIGFAYNGLLYSFGSFISQAVYGQILNWVIACNANEIK